jgi:histidine ammonia-lyase
MPEPSSPDGPVLQLGPGTTLSCEDVELVDAAEALDEAGPDPLRLGCRDALGLVNGTAFMTAYAALAAARGHVGQLRPACDLVETELSGAVDNPVFDADGADALLYLDPNGGAPPLLA